MSALSDAYREHGKKMRKNMEERKELYDLMDNDINAFALERELCHIDDPDVDFPTGIYRFFENHLCFKNLLSRAFLVQFDG